MFVFGESATSLALLKVVEPQAMEETDTELVDAMQRILLDAHAAGMSVVHYFEGSMNSSGVVEAGKCRYQSSEDERLLYIDALEELETEGFVRFKGGILYEITRKGRNLTKRLLSSRGNAERGAGTQASIDCLSFTFANGADIIQCQQIESIDSHIRRAEDGLSHLQTMAGPPISPVHQMIRPSEDLVEKYRSYLEELLVFRDRSSRTAELSFVIRNNGEQAIEEVEVYIEFPTKTEFSLEKPLVPEEPFQPQYPFDSRADSCSVEKKNVAVGCELTFSDYQIRIRLDRIRKYQSIYLPAIFATFSKLDLPQELRCLICSSLCEGKIESVLRVAADSAHGPSSTQVVSENTVAQPTVAKKDSEIPKVDLLLVTVNRHETQAVIELVKERVGNEPKIVGGPDRQYRDLGSINGTRIFHALSGMGSGGPGGAQLTVSKAIQYLRPGAVVGIGIAFGIDGEKQNIGDILISRQIQLYDFQKIGNDRVQSRGDKVHASVRLIDYFDGVAQTTWNGTNVTTGLVLSGEKLVDNFDYRSYLKSLEPEAIGGEMEGAGVYVASQDQKIDWIIIKSICDWADGNKSHDKESRQKMAAKNAVEFLIHALLQAPLRRSGEREVE